MSDCVQLLPDISFVLCSASLSSYRLEYGYGDPCCDSQLGSRVETPLWEQIEHKLAGVWANDNRFCTSSGLPVDLWERGCNFNVTIGFWHSLLSRVLVDVCTNVRQLLNGLAVFLFVDHTFPVAPLWSSMHGPEDNAGESVPSFSYEGLGNRTQVSRWEEVALSGSAFSLATLIGKKKSTHL